MIEVITGVSAEDLKYKFDKFQANNYEEPISRYSGGKKKVIDKADCTTNGTDFIMTVAYHWEKMAAR